MTTAGAPVSVGTFVVLQFNNPQAVKEFKEAYEEGDSFDFGECEENDVKIVAEFEGVGQGVIV